MHHQYTLITNSHTSHILATIHPSQDIDMFACMDNNDLIISDGDYDSCTKPAQPLHNTPATIDHNPFLLDDHEEADALAIAMC